MIIRRIGPLSVAKIVALLYACFGLCFGAVFSILSLAGVAFGSGNNIGLPAIFGIGAIVLLPILYGGLGFVFSMIATAIYNVLAGVVGGIEIETQ